MVFACVSLLGPDRLDRADKLKSNRSQCRNRRLPKQHNQKICSCFCALLLGPRLVCQMPGSKKLVSAHKNVRGSSWWAMPDYKIRWSALNLHKIWKNKMFIFEKSQKLIETALRRWYDQKIPCNSLHKRFVSKELWQCSNSEGYAKLPRLRNKHNTLKMIISLKISLFFAGYSQALQMPNRACSACPACCIGILSILSILASAFHSSRVELAISDSSNRSYVIIIVRLPACAWAWAGQRKIHLRFNQFHSVERQEIARERERAKDRDSAIESNFA